MRRIRKGDEVVVIAGKDKGKRGNVLRVMPDGRVVVSDVNMVKRHTKPNPGRGVPGGIIEKEMAVACLQCHVVQPANQQGRPGRLQDPGQRSQGALFQVHQ